MRTALSWAVAVIVALAALVGLITLLNSRDKSGVKPNTAAVAGPGKPYTGTPVLSPALEDAVKKGNVVVLYRDEEPPAGTEGLVPPGAAELERAGQSVVLEREPTLKSPLAAVSAKKIEAADVPDELREFIDYWLGGR